MTSRLRTLAISRYGQLVTLCNKSLKTGKNDVLKQPATSKTIISVLELRSWVRSKAGVWLGKAPWKASWLGKAFSGGALVCYDFSTLVKKSVKSIHTDFFIFLRYFPKSFSDADSLGVFSQRHFDLWASGMGRYADSVISSDRVKGNKTTPGVRCHIVHT